MRDLGYVAVTLRDITREAVLSAIVEYDQLGQEEFLNRHGFDLAGQYVHDGKRCDSNAIVNVARGFLPGKTALAATEFSGGKARVGRLMARLGCHVEDSAGEHVDALIRQLTRLRVCRRDGMPAQYQPITLLWAFAHEHTAAQSRNAGSRSGSRTAAWSIPSTP
jgi:5-methylcytosine-specific restriction protein A